MNELIDTHCHLNFASFDQDRENVLERAAAAGVKYIIAPAIDLDSCRGVLALAEENASVYAAVGIHPNSSAKWQPSWLDELRLLATHEKVLAIGEIGLDYYRDYSPRAIQRDAFRHQLELASDLGLPVIIHNRDSDTDLLDILRNSKVTGRPKPGVLHSFSSTIEVATMALDNGFFLGFTGPITYKNAEELREVVKAVPQDRILVETDAPFLAPQIRRGKRNEPAFVRYIVEKMGEILHLSYSEIARQTTMNARHLFGLPAATEAD
jgi:TatD DNase family protein